MKNNTLLRKLFLFLFYLLPLFSIASAIQKEELEKQVVKWVKNQPVKFLENKGQMLDMKKNPVPFVLFKAEVPGIDFYITEKGLTYVFIKPEEKDKNFSYEWSRVDMILKNASIKKENIIKEGESKSVSHYYNGNTTIRDVHNYEKITIKEIYPGIDWMLYNSNDKGFKYDFIIHPNADASQIKLIYEGAGEMFAEKNQFRFKNELGEMIEGSLYCYQGGSGNEINSRYLTKKIDNRQKVVNKFSQLETLNFKPETFKCEVSIQLDSYNKNQPLVIDPQVVWASYIGGNGAEGPLSITCDPNNNVLITGYQGATNFPTLNPGGGAFFQGTSISNGSTNDSFVMKFDNNGVLFWSTYISADRGSTANTIASDLLGNILVVGATTSTNFPTFNPGGGAYYQGARADSVDAFIMKFNPAGVLSWGTYYGGDSNDVATTVHVDAFNNIYVVGASNSLNLPVQNGGGYYQAANAGGNDGILLKFNNAGVRQHATYFGGSATDMAHAITSDVAGNIFFTGQTDSPNFPTLNSGTFFQAANAGATDVFITKLSNTLNINWSTYYGGTALDATSSIACDQTGNIFLGGYSSSPTIPLMNPGSGAYFQAANAGNQDAFILKFSNTGVQQWSTFYGGTGMDYFKTPFNNLTVDLCNNVYLTFATMSNDIPTQASCDAGYNPLTLKGPADCFILKFTNGGVRLWGIYMGGDGFDFRESNCVDKLGNFFMTGEWHQPTNQATYPVTNPGGGAFYDATHNSGDDGYIIKFSPTNVSLAASSTNAGCNCTGTATATPTGGCAPYQYLWYNNSWSQIGNTQTINNLCAGTYHVIVRDSMMCSLPDTATVTITGGVPPVLLSQNPTICMGGNYTLPDGSIVNTAGTYVDTLLSGNGCDTIITTTLTTTNILTSSQNAVICAGQSFTMPDGSIGTTSGTYIDTLTAINGGCDSIITTTLVVNPAATLSQTISICQGLSYTLPSGNTVSTSGIYFDTLTTAAGCDSIITTNLTVKPNSTLSQNHTMCSGNIYTLPSGTIVTTSGTYIDTLLSANGCDSIITTTVTVNPTPTANVGSNVTIISGQSTTLTATGGGTYNWSPSTGLDSTTTSSVIAAPTSTTTYCVEVTSTNGCKDTACVTVTVEIACPIISTLALPNAFSPNNDGVNDEFCLQGWTPCNKSFLIMIYDRWGEKVFESKDPNFCWDGNFKGNTMDAQVFVYYVKADFINTDEKIVKEGNITLIR